MHRGKSFRESAPSNWGSWALTFLCPFDGAIRGNDAFNGRERRDDPLTRAMQFSRDGRTPLHFLRFPHRSFLPLLFSAIQSAFWITRFFPRIAKNVSSKQCKRGGDTFEGGKFYTRHHSLSVCASCFCPLLLKYRSEVNKIWNSLVGTYLLFPARCYKILLGILDTFTLVHKDLCYIYISYV